MACWALVLIRKRWPSGVTLQVPIIELTVKSLCGRPALNAPSAVTLMSTAIASKVGDMKNSSLPSRRHAGRLPPLVEI